MPIVFAISVFVCVLLLYLSLSYCWLCLCQISLFIPSVLMPHKRWKVDVSRVDGSAQPGFATDLSLICIIITLITLINDSEDVLNRDLFLFFALNFFRI